MRILNRIAFTTIALTGFLFVPSGDVIITIDHNDGMAATPDFRFKNVPSPVKDDAATNAQLTMLVGRPDSNGGGLNALNDGKLPSHDDDPRANFFFNAGAPGGRFRMDFGTAIDIAQVNTYSWHPGARGPQLYNLYASDGSAPGFDPTPNGRTDPAKAGWKLIAEVDTRPKKGDKQSDWGGQYGVSITGASGSLGKFRYLIFDCAETETRDDFGNTFYSEIDVVERKKQ